MKNKYKMPKIEDIKVSISSSFVMRARCKYCGETPSKFFWITNDFLKKNVVDMVFDASFDKEYIKRMNNDWYLCENPRLFTGNRNLVFSLFGKSYSPKLHKSIGNDIKDRDNITEMLSCKCGKSFWAYNNKSIKEKPEIINRKGRYSFDQKFVF